MTAEKTAENTAEMMKLRSEREEERRRARKQLRYHSLSALYRKEMSDNVSGRRFIIILAMVVVTTVASLYGAVTGLREALLNPSSTQGTIDTANLFLKLYSSGGNSIPSYMSLMALIGPFVGLILGFDAINSERMSGTLNRLVSQPIYRDSIIIGKFLASTTLIVVMVFSTGILVGSVGFLALGIRPNGEQLLRVVIYLIYTVVYMCFWLATAMLFSVICRHSATSALASIALWLFFAIFMSLIAGAVASAVYPVTNDYEKVINSVANYNLQQNLNRISPYYLYSEAASIIMNPMSRAINAVTYAQLVGAISGYLSLGQSLLLVLPHLVGLVALTFAVFTISYIVFMRQEVRSS